MGRADLKAKIRLEGDASGATKAIKKTESGFKKLGKSIRTGALAVTGALASMLGAYKLLESAGERLGQKRSLERTLEAQGIAIDDFIGKLKSLANNQIATSDLVLASNRALALGISSDDLPGLLEAATKASVSLGISATQAFNDITTGVGRASPLILDNLGIVVDAVKVYAAYAAEIGVSTEALTKQQKTAALSAAVMKNAAKGAADFADAQSRVTVALSQSRTRLKEWFETVVDGIASSDALATSIEGVSAGMSDYAAATRGVIRALLDLLPVQEKSRKSLVDQEIALRALPIGLFEFNKVIRQYGQEVKTAEEAQEKQRLGLIAADAAYDQARGTMESAADATKRLADEQTRLKTEADASATAMEKLGTALGIVTAAQLEAQIVAIEKAMQDASDATQGFSQELIDAEAEGGRQIDSLRLRVTGLGDGLGDMGKDAADAALGFDQLSDAIGGTGIAAADAGNSVDDLTGSIDDADGGMTGLSASVRDTSSALSAQASQARATASELTQLTAVAESLALAEARTQLALTQQARKRITGTEGSRDQNVGRFTGRFVGPVGTYTLNPDGTLTPA